MTDAATGEVIYGAWRAPTNIAADAAGSIHDDATAQSLGLRGGTVAGSIHLEQFPPLLERVFGEAWWRTGGVSLFFVSPTLDGEPVRTAARRQSVTRAEVWLEAEDGRRVAEGSASLGDDPDSALRRRVTEARPATDLRMLGGVRVGDTGAVGPVRVPEADIDRHLPVITERLPDYERPDRFGGRVVPGNRLVDLFRAVEPAMLQVHGAFVGLYGAIEIQHLAGPVLAERDYTLNGRVLALSESPKTEAIWYEATLSEGGTEVARFLHMSRLLKASSLLWSEDAAGA